MRETNTFSECVLPGIGWIFHQNVFVQIFIIMTRAAHCHIASVYDNDDDDDHNGAMQSQLQKSPNLLLLFGNSLKTFANGALRIVHAFAIGALYVSSAFEFIKNRRGRRRRRRQRRVFVVVDLVAAAVIKIDFHSTNVFALDALWHFFFSNWFVAFFPSLTSCVWKKKKLRVKLEYWMANKTTVCVCPLDTINFSYASAHTSLFCRLNQSSFLKTIDTNRRKWTKKTHVSKRPSMVV